MGSVGRTAGSDWNGHDCTIQPEKLRFAAVVFAALAFIMGMFGFAVSKTVEEKRDTRSSGDPMPTLDELTGTAWSGLVSLEPRESLSVPEHTYSPIHSTWVSRPSSDQSLPPGTAQEMTSDSEEPLDPPPPYSPTRAPTYVE